ncbi:lytic murein transglycosylase [Phyllobacterium bourgognense]|uniref:Lytic murein transglycosylase n=1 Tax=Phyllobacterium bourgognense TaxID=314236 RepID=A0A368Z4V5_9HYPH|nr:lytic murein transglycosylase [Phyllobacterium bourgognense]RCW87483.1 lytic murein transglycosylase [Phyllobacterium bourgognense]
MITGLVRFAIVLIGVLLSSSAFAVSKAEVESQFEIWLANDLWPEAKSKGISKTVFDQAFSGVSLNFDLPDLVMPGEKPQTPKKQTQSEFGSPGKYFNDKTINAVTSGGTARAGQYSRILKAVEAKYGVPGEIVLAIWGRESGYGSVKIPNNAFTVLGTKAFMATRKDMFREELVAALEIVQRGYIGAGSMKSSWAGALGQPQFMPSSYLEHAVDFDGDGKRDIWNSVPDTLGSIAHYLAQYGWQKGRDWGYEVNVPANVSCALEGPDQGKPFTAWEKLGITRVNGKPFPSSETKREGFLLLPAGRHGPAFIVTKNFYVIKEYNMSDLYALFISHVGDRIAHGATGFSASWGDIGGLHRSDIAGLQRVLENKGYDAGGADGFPGFKTRRSIGDWQAKQGMAPTCFPDKDLITTIR